MASMGFPIRCNPLSIMRATGLAVFLARERAADTFPENTLSRIIFMKLGSILLAFRIAISRSKKKNTARMNSSARGIIIGPPLVSISIKFILEEVLAAARWALIIESVLITGGFPICKKNQFIR